MYPTTDERAAPGFSIFSYPIRLRRFDNVDDYIFIIAKLHAVVENNGVCLTLRVDEDRPRVYE